MKQDYSELIARITTQKIDYSHKKNLYATIIHTPFEPMLALADDTYLYLFDFVQSSHIERKINYIKRTLVASVQSGHTKIHKQIEEEINRYFNGTLQEFTTPIHLSGTSFQQQVWQQLKTISYGKTCSYLKLAAALHKPKAYRAVAQANGANFFSIIIPCHRIIQTDGKLGGYSGGLSHKQRLLNHEKTLTKIY